MIETIILEEPSARRRFRTAPCLEERERYLFHLMRRGFGRAYLRTVSFFLLRIIEFLSAAKDPVANTVINAIEATALLHLM